MANISRQFAEDIVLPDGSTASSVADVERYLRANGLAHGGDYSDDYYKNIRFNNEKQRQSEAFAAFVNNYKKVIWE